MYTDNFYLRNNLAISEPFYVTCRPKIHIHTRIGTGFNLYLITTPTRQMRYAKNIHTPPPPFPPQP